jgi:uncharacterized protein DUF6893
VRIVQTRSSVKHHSTRKRTAAIVGLIAAAAAIVARTVGPDLKRYIRIKTM